MMSRSRSLRTLSAILAVVLAAGVDEAAAQAPVIRGLRPLGLQPGQTTQLAVTGQHLSAVEPLWTSIGATYPLAAGIENNGNLGDRATFECALPGDAPLGLHSLRVVTAGGVSTQRLWLVDDLPAVAQEEGNLTLATAQSVAKPTAVDGLIGNLQRRYFRFDAAAGERVAVEVFARRLGSPLDPLLVLYRGDGRQVATSDDVPGLGGDSQLAYQCESAGPCVIELRDIRYRGGDDYAFRLRIGDFPLVQATYPLAVQRGTSTPVAFTGRHAGEVAAVEVAAPAERTQHWLSVPARRTNGQCAGFTTVVLSDRPEFLEQEPNNDTEQANAVTVEQNLNGRFEASFDVDRYRFTVEKGARVLFQGITRQEGTPADLQLRVLDTSGKQLATADDDGVNEGRIDHTFAEAGDYVLEATDLLHRGGPEFVYRVEVTPYAGGFRLAVSGDGLNVPAGGTVIVPVQATRRGYNGAIELAVEGLPDECTAAPATIGPGLNLGHVSFTTPADSPAVPLTAVRIVGKARIGGQPYQATGDCADWLRDQWSQLAVVPPEARASIVVHGAPAPRLALSVEPAEIVFGPDLSGAVTIRARRAEGLSGDVTLATLPEKDALPKEVSLELKPIPKDADEVTLKFSATGKAALGAFSLVLHGTLKQDKETVVAPTPAISYRLAAPFAVTLDKPPRPFKVGGELEWAVQIERNPAFSGAIALKLSDVPAGVTAPEVTIPADASTAVLKLAAASDAKAGTFKDVKLTAVAADNAKLSVERKLPEFVIE
jgi:hypothetical protein